jgi:hypothetical protein
MFHVVLMHAAAYQVIMAAAPTSKVRRASTIKSPDHSSGFSVRRSQRPVTTCSWSNYSRTLATKLRERATQPMSRERVSV